MLNVQMVHTGFCTKSDTENNPQKQNYLMMEILAGGEEENQSLKPVTAPQQH